MLYLKLKKGDYLDIVSPTDTATMKVSNIDRWVTFKWRSKTANCRHTVKPKTVFTGGHINKENLEFTVLRASSSTVLLGLYPTKDVHVYRRHGVQKLEFNYGGIQ